MIGRFRWAGESGSSAASGSAGMNFIGRLVVGLVAFAVAFAPAAAPDPAHAVSVPRVIIDGYSYTVTDVKKAYVSGTVEPAAGQLIMLFLSDKKTMIGSFRVSGMSGRASFKIRVPEGRLKGNSSLKLYLKSGSAGYVTASKYIPITLKIGLVGTKPTTKPTTRPTTRPTTKPTAGPTTKPTARPTTKPTTRPTIIPTTRPTRPTITPPTRPTRPTKPPTRPTRPKARPPAKPSRPITAAQGRAAAVAWAKKIAADNRFAYGAVPYSRHNGCYYCGTNGGKKKRARGTRWSSGYRGKKWKMTYCCNPFVHAAYAHGARHPKMLRYCKRKKAIDMTKASYRKMGCFKCLGKPGLYKLVPGDILVSRNHVSLYCGKGKIVEATSLGGGKRSWSAASIRVSKNAKKRYRNCRFVMRFTGYK